MGRQETRAEQQNRTRRTVARLLSLAEMVERSAFQLTFVRFFLLWLLRPAETLIFRHVCAMASDAGLPDLPEEFGLLDEYETPDSATEALVMAQRLRALANIIVLLDAFENTLRSEQDHALRIYFRQHMSGLSRRVATVSLLKLRASAMSQLERPEVRSAPTCSALSGHFAAFTHT